MTEVKAKVKVTEQIIGYDVTISKEEAEALLCLLGHCSSTGILYKLYKALDNVGVDSKYSAEKRNGDEVECIYLNPKS